MSNYVAARVVAVPVCRPARPTRAHPSLAVQAKVETQCLRMEVHHFRMETPLRGRSGGHTGAAPTISRVAPCPKVAGE